MAKRSFNFNKIERPTIEITLKGETESIEVYALSKELYETVVALISREEKGETPKSRVLDGICAKILSNNSEGREITPEYVTENYDFGDTVTFIREFMQFTTEELQGNPN